MLYEELILNCFYFFAKHIASTEDDFFFPGSCKFAWTSAEGDKEESVATNFSLEKLIRKQHGVQYDPKNKVNEFRL